MISCQQAFREPVAFRREPLPLLPCVTTTVHKCCAELSVAILNVDDNGPSRFLRSRILTGAGFEVREAESAAQALSDALTDRPPSLVLLDVSLPDGDGFTVCEQLKATYPDVPVVMITSVYHNARARLEGFQSGADEYPAGSGRARPTGGRRQSIP